MKMMSNKKWAMIIIPLEYTLNKKYTILNLANSGGIIFYGKTH